MEKTLQSCWFDIFKRKLMTDFCFDVTKIDNYQPDISPIVYCCLMHRRVTKKSREVVISKEIQDSTYSKDDNWISFRDKIERGDDINEYMSKNINKWESLDYLLYTCNISHFHLSRNKRGGIGKTLVFGVFKEDYFYALYIGDHNDLYKPDFFASIAESNWPDSNILKIKETVESECKFDQKFFKRVANNPNLQFNMITPAHFTDQHGQAKGLDNHQNTTLVKFELNGIDIGKIPFKVYCAYKNEIEFLENLDKELYQTYKAKKMSLEIDEAKGRYSIEIHLQRSKKITRGIPKNFITCSRYQKFNNL